MASYSNVLLVDQYGNERIVNVPISWKVKESRVVPVNKRNYEDYLYSYVDPQQLKEQFNVEELTKRDDVKIKATSSELKVKERLEDQIMKENEEEAEKDNIKVIFEEVINEDLYVEETKESKTVESPEQIETEELIAFTNTENDLDNQEQNQNAEQKDDTDDIKEDLQEENNKAATESNTAVTFDNNEIKTQINPAIANPVIMDRDKQVNEYEISNVAVYEIDMEKLAESLVYVLDKEGANETSEEEEPEEEEIEEDDIITVVSRIFGGANNDNDTNNENAQTEQNKE